MSMNRREFTRKDVKLSNIVVNNDDRSTLIDCGCVACVMTEGRSDYPLGLTLQN